MHHDNYTGMTSDGVFTGDPHALFISGIPSIGDAKPFLLKTVDDDTINTVRQR